MPTVVAQPSTNRIVAAGAILTDTQIATGVSTNHVDRRALTGPADLVITYTDTGAQTVTFDIQGCSDIDEANWWNIPYALIATPSTFVLTAVTFSTGGGGTVHYLLQSGQPWRWLRLNVTAITDTTVDAVVYCYAP